MRILSFTLVAIGLVILNGISWSQDYGAAPNEWSIPHYFGHTGTSPSTVIRPPFKVKWGVRVPGLVSGEGGRGPIVAGGKIVLFGQRFQLVCLDTADGRMVWRTSIPEPEFGSASVQNARFDPCIAKGRVYAVFSVQGNPAANGIRCFDLNTGDSLWKRDAGFSGSRKYKESPIYSNGRLYLHSVRDVNQSTLAQNNYCYKSQVQAWDAVTGDTLWTYTLWDTLNTARVNAANANTAYHPALCVIGDTIFASLGISTDTGRTVALLANGGNVREIWTTREHHVPQYGGGGIQYFEGKLLLGAGERAVDARSGSLIWTSTADNYSKISPIMNGKFWNKNYGGSPRAHSLATGAVISGWARLISGDGYSSGCTSPRAANGYIFSGFGNARGAIGALQYPGYSNDYPKHYVWDEAGNPVFWFSSPDNVTRFPPYLVGNSCQPVAIAYDRFYWVSNQDGWVFCYENDTRTVASFKAICIPETLEQYWPGSVKAVIRYTNGNTDTTSLCCQYKSLDSTTSMVRVEGAVYPRNPGTALIQVSRFGQIDTAHIPIRPSRSILDNPYVIRRINFQQSWHPYRYGWLTDDGTLYSPAKHHGWMNSSFSLLGASIAGTGSNFLMESSVRTKTGPLQYRIDVPDGAYAIRIGMGYSWAASSYDWVAFSGDTIARKPAGTKNTIGTDTLVVTGGKGLTLTIQGAICYLVLCSADKGINLCNLADDDYNCGNTGFEANVDESYEPFIKVAPNPFSPGTRIGFSLTHRQHLSVTIMNLLGQPVRRFASHNFGPGVHTLDWNGRDDRGHPLASGFYFIRLHGEAFERTTRAQIFR